MTSALQAGTRHVGSGEEFRCYAKCNGEIESIGLILENSPTF